MIGCISMFLKFRDALNEFTLLMASSRATRSSISSSVNNAPVQKQNKNNDFILINIITFSLIKIYLFKIWFGLIWFKLKLNLI